MESKGIDLYAGATGREVSGFQSPSCPYNANNPHHTNSVTISNLQQPLIAEAAVSFIFVRVNCSSGIVTIRTRENITSSEFLEVLAAKGSIKAAKGSLKFGNTLLFQNQTLKDAGVKSKDILFHLDEDSTSQPTENDDTKQNPGPTPEELVLETIRKMMVKVVDSKTGLRSNFFVMSDVTFQNVLDRWMEKRGITSGNYSLQIDGNDVSNSDTLVAHRLKNGIEIVAITKG